jgi:hypothetical protein
MEADKEKKISKSKSSKSIPNPPPLPKEKWRKNDKGCLMKRKCKFCDRWHFDYDCPSKLVSYNITTSYDQWESISSANEESEATTSDDDNSSSTSSDAGDRLRYRTTKDITPTYHNVYSIASPDSTDDITIPRANEYCVEELPAAFAVGTGISYLSAQPCPVKAWVGTSPNAGRPLKTGVVDSGGPSIIARHLVPKSFTIRDTPLRPVFGGIGDSKTPAHGYVVLSVHLPNASALSGDARNARVAKIWVEFQVVEKCPVGYLIGVDAIQAYKMILDYQKSSIILTAFANPLRIPIADGTKYTSKRADPCIYAAETVSIQPFSSIWVPIKFAPFAEQTDLLVTPVRHANISEGTYASCSYAVMTNKTSHLLVANPSPRPAIILREEVVEMYEPFTPCTPFSYCGIPTITTMAPMVGGLQLFMVSMNAPPAIPNYSIITKEDLDQLTTDDAMTTTTKSTLDTGHLKDISLTLGLNNPELTWHTGIDEPVDPFGLIDEFKETGPLQDQPPDSDSSMPDADSANTKI